jgi:hypothetical protein
LDFLNASQIVTVLIALTGWLFVHRLSAWRDRVNHKRQIQTEYLISAFRRLANSANRAPQANSTYFRDMESAIADIQLFGDKNDVELVKGFLNEFSSNGQASMDTLLSTLRSKLRKELNYDEVTENVNWFRPEGSPDTNA